MKITYTAVEAGQYGQALEMATRIWKECYAAILSPGQIDYMLGEMYHPAKIAGEIGAGVVWEFIAADGEPAGFVSYALEGSRVFLKKIYFFSHFRGVGLLPGTLARVEEYAKSNGAGSIYLTVNKNNERAVRAYTKSGFTVEREQVVDIGSGYVMDDYVLSKNVG